MSELKSSFLVKRAGSVLTGMAQLVGHCATKQKVASTISSQGTCLGGWFDGPQSGYVQEATD